jgi:hypothetical protein
MRLLFFVSLSSICLSIFKKSINKFLIKEKLKKWLSSLLNNRMRDEYSGFIHQKFLVYLKEILDIKNI